MSPGARKWVMLESNSKLSKPPPPPTMACAVRALSDGSGMISSSFWPSSLISPRVVNSPRAAPEALCSACSSFKARAFLLEFIASVTTVVNDPTLRFDLPHSTPITISSENMAFFLLVCTLPYVGLID